MIALLAFPALLAGQGTPPATPDSDEKKPEMGYYRFWALVPTTAGSFDLILPKSGDEAEVLSVNRTNFSISADYDELKPGRYDFTIIRNGAPDEVIAHQEVVLRKDMFMTLVLSSKDGRPKLELVDDTLNPEITTGRLTIRHCLEDSRAAVTIPKIAVTPVLTYGDTRSLENLPRKRLLATAIASRGNEPSATSSREVDLTKFQHATLFLVRDVYGRFRPRLTFDGQNDE